MKDFQRFAALLLLALGGTSVAANAADAVVPSKFGAKCDGATDDTASLQAAIDSVAASSTPAQIGLPGGVCVITAPLVMNRNAYVVGTGVGSVIRADFARWRGASLVALDIEAKQATQAAIFSTMHRVFSGFAIEGTGQTGEQSTTAIKVHGVGEIPATAAVNYAFMGGFRDIVVRNFDIGMDILEMWSSTIDHLSMTGCRQGVKIHGKAANLQFQHLMLTNFNNTPNAGNPGPTVGIAIDSGFHYAGGREGRPEGVLVADSLVFGAANNIVVTRVLKGDIVDSIVDGALQSAAIIVGGDQVTLRNNYLFTSSASAAVVQVSPVSAVVRGLNLLDNHIVASGGPGILIAKGGVAREGVRVDGNRFEAASRPILVQGALQKSSIRNNYGNRNTGPLITLDAGGRALVIEGNNSGDAFPALSIGRDVQLSVPPSANGDGS